MAADQNWRLKTEVDGSREARHLDALVERAQTTGGTPQPGGELASDLVITHDGNKLFVERVTERVKPKPWGVQLSAGFSRERVLAAYGTIATRYAALLADKDTTIVSSFFRSRGTETFYQVRVGADTFESANNLCAELRRAGGACMVLRNKLNQDSDPNSGSVSAKAVDNVTQF